MEPVVSEEPVVRCVLRWIEVGGKRTCEGVLVDARRRVLDRVSGSEVEVRREVERRYPGIEYR